MERFADLQNSSKPGKMSGGDLGSKFLGQKQSWLAVWVWGFVNTTLEEYELMWDWVALVRRYDGISVLFGGET